MAEFLLDLLFRFVAWGVVAFGAGVIAHALCTDQAIGLIRRAKARRGLAPPRLRCPGGYRRFVFVPVRQGCWYDMTGIDAGEDGRAVCPECGRRSRAKRLGRSKRRWRLGMVGVCVMGFGLATLYARAVYHHGWKAVPDGVLALVPFDERDWIENDLPNAHWMVKAAATEIRNRHEAGELSAWASARVGRRVQARYERDADYGVDEASRAAFEKVASTPFTGGIDNRPFSEAVATIAAAAGVELTLDRAAMEAAAIEPDRRITVPAFGSMTCEMALDWACDRARAMRGWASGEWTVEGGRVVVSESGTVVPDRRLVLVRPMRGRKGTIEAESWVFQYTNLMSGPGQSMEWIGDAIEIGTTGLGVLRLERVWRTIQRGEGLTIANRQEVNAMHERMATGRITPLEGDETFDVAIHRVRSELGVAVGVDGWGINVYQTLREAMAARGLVGMDRTAPNADPFGRDRDGGDIEPIEEALSAIRLFHGDIAHDDTSVVIGLRTGMLVSITCAHRFPQRPVGAAMQGPEPPVGSRERPMWEWQRDALALQSRLAEVASGIGGMSAVIRVTGDRVIVIGPINLQVVAAEVIEEFARERGWWDE